MQHFSESSICSRKEVPFYSEGGHPGTSLMAWVVASLTNAIRGGEGRGVKMLYTYIQTYRQTERQTYRPSDEVGCRGAFGPKNGLNQSYNDKILYIYLIFSRFFVPI